jgi:Flp pilus assembly protein TadG
LITTPAIDRSRRRRSAAAVLPRARRRGIAATELAVCMPVIVLVVLATMETCAMMFLQQSLSVAAYEGARVALAGAPSSEVTAQCQRILDDREIRGANVTLTPSNVSGATAGTWITVETRAPFDQNSLAGGWLFGARKLTATVQMMKER